MATTIAIDDEADELLAAKVIEQKKQARSEKKSTRAVTKRNIASDLIKRALRVPPLRKPRTDQPTNRLTD